ncbi:MAG: hypothetical protein LBP87_05680 [Planctomycetaceae bacterium]|jgi:hypothetical protein|nr:hypothetical protein [Planctomycetaceae bacterium]
MTNQNETKKVWTAEEIHTNIHQSYKWLVRAVLALYQLQTNEEKTQKTTIAKNNIGFNVIDARYMSNIAQQLQTGKHLTMKEQYIARRTLKKYYGQLLRIANSK